MGVGAVISGDFFGWNFGLTAGGFGGMLVAVIVMTVMYIGLCFSIAEMSPALPHAGGAYSFARTSMGPWARLHHRTRRKHGVHSDPRGDRGRDRRISGRGVRNAARVGAALVAALLRRLRRAEHLGRRDDVPRFGGRDADRAGRSGGVLGRARRRISTWRAGQRPISPPESVHGKRRWWSCRSRSGCISGSSSCRSLPRRVTTRSTTCRAASCTACVTLIACSFLTVVLSAGIAPGAAKVGASNEPLFLGIPDDLRRGLEVARARAGRLRRTDRELPHDHFRLRPPDLFALARRLFSDVAFGDAWQTPDAAPRVARRLGARDSRRRSAIHLTPQGSPVGAVLLNMAVFGAVIAYILQMVSFIVLRLRFPKMERPYRSRIGITGAAVAGVDRGGDAIDAVRQSRLQQRGDRRGGVVLARDRLLRGPRAPSAGAVSGRGSGLPAAARSLAVIKLCNENRYLEYQLGAPAPASRARLAGPASSRRRCACRRPRCRITSSPSMPSARPDTTRRFAG